MQDEFSTELPIKVLDILPNPVLIKGADYRYVWVNRSFETLFQVDRNELLGHLDSEFFQDRQVAQCNGGDKRVLEKGEIDEAYETVFDKDGSPRETITRKIRLTLSGGEVFLVGIMHDVTEVVTANRMLEEQSKELSRLANTDPLTKCLNRRAFYDVVSKECGEENGMLMLDLDYFKSINDNFGHEVGDVALNHFVEISKSQIRSNDVLARLGGEEFAIYLPSATEGDLESIAERIRATIEANPLHYNGQEIKMTVSIGGCMHKAPKSFDLQDMLSLSDNNLYKAKSEGRNKIILTA